MRDLPPKRRLSVGDSDILTGRFLNTVPQFGKPKGAVVGGLIFSWFVQSTKRVQASAAAQLPPGAVLKIEGRLDLSKDSQTLLVTKGSPGTAYDRARGTVTFSDVKGHPKEALVVFHLRY